MHSTHSPPLARVAPPSPLQLSPRPLRRRRLLLRWPAGGSDRRCTRSSRRRAWRSPSAGCSSTGTSPETQKSGLTRLAGQQVCLKTTRRAGAMQCTASGALCMTRHPKLCLRSTEWNTSNFISSFPIGCEVHTPSACKYLTWIGGMSPVK